MSDAVPLPEYPRPQLVRDSYLNLNGRWQYAITEGADDREPDRYDGDILVPYSPEAPLSGVGRTLRPGQWLWYRRALALPADFGGGGRVLLHFGAVDQTCAVFVNGVEVGSHVGGYLPFSCDITDALTANDDRAGAATLVVRVRDDSDTCPHSRGKQKTRRGGIWYTAQSGIWQTVWAERVPDLFVRSLTLTPHLADGCLEVTAEAPSPEPGAPEASVEIDILADGAVIARAETRPGIPVRVPIPALRPWTPEDPFLYDVTVRLRTGDVRTDEVRSYAGVRSFGVGPDAEGVPRLLLNGSPYFHAGVLDQGYWPDGLCTPPSDEALVHDIATMKRLGFTMLRKHIKIEPLRWYHHCDRLGMLVWQDMVNGGGAYRPTVITLPAVLRLRLRDRNHRWFGRADAQGRAQFETELRDTVEHLRSVVSLAVWVPFNEGWGQFDAARIAADLARLDPTRTVDHASGWHDQGAGNLRSLHVYFRRFRVPRSWSRRDRRVLVLSEYGGYSLPVEGHTWGAKEFGYRRFASADELGAALARLHEEQIIPALARGLSATVYTQLSDVEDELNGLLTYDRAVLKLPEDQIRALTERLRLP